MSVRRWLVAFFANPECLSPRASACNQVEATVIELRNKTVMSKLVAKGGETLRGSSVGGRGRGDRPCFCRSAAAGVHAGPTSDFGAG